MASKLLHLQGPYTSTREFKPPLLSSCARQNLLATVPQSSSGGRDLLSPPLRISTQRNHWNKVRALTVCSLFNAPLIAPQHQWGNWTALVPLALSVSVLFPVAVPLLLYRTVDLRRVRNSTGALFFAFLLGSVATTVGTLLVFSIALVLYLGRQSWKMAAAVMGGNIGGAANGIAISNSLGIRPSDFAAGQATHCKFVQMDTKSASSDSFPVLRTATALAVSLAICKLGSCLTTYFGFQGGSLPAVAAIVVVLGTIFPKKLEHLAQSGEAMAMILMQRWEEEQTYGPLSVTVRHRVFSYSLIQLAIHLALILGLGKLSRFDLKMLLIASNANVGGPTTACGMAIAKEWASMVAPGILVGFFGCAISTSLVTLFGDFLQFL
ncbi:hypothetical protein UlMin_024507 [Ulmus minor]